MQYQSDKERNTYIQKEAEGKIRKRKKKSGRKKSQKKAQTREKTKKVNDKKNALAPFQNDDKV